MKRKSNRKKNIKKNKKGGFIETLGGIGTTYVLPIAGRILSIAFLAFLSIYFKGKISQTNAILKQPEYIQAALNKKAAKTDRGIFPANRLQNVGGPSKASMLKDKLGSLSIPKPNMPQLGQQSLPEVQGEVVEQPQEQPTPGAKDAIVGNIQENLEAAKNTADSGEPVTPPSYVPPGMVPNDSRVIENPNIIPQGAQSPADKKQAAVNNLKGRFPNATDAEIKDALNKSGDHGGKAAKLLSKKTPPAGDNKPGDKTPAKTPAKTPPRPQPRTIKTTKIREQKSAKKAARKLKKKK